MNKLWNGNRAALSLTFDDALPCQIEYAIPQMDKRGIQGTFFPIAECNQYPFDRVKWPQVIKAGHEIGSHSVNHFKAAILTAENAEYETAHSKYLLEKQFDAPVVSFCYPFTDAPELLQNAVRKAGYKQARGGRVARSDKYVTPKDGVNLFNMPCLHANDGVLSTQGEMWIYAALERGAWLTLMLHGVGDNGNDWDNVFPNTWENFLDFLQRMRDRGLWIAPFGTVAENLRGNQ